MFQTCDPSQEGPVLTPGASYEQSWYKSTGRCFIPNIKALHFLVSEKKNFKVFLLCSYVSNLWPPGRGQFWPQGHHMNNLGRGPLGDATYQISKLYAFYIRRRSFSKILLFFHFGCHGNQSYDWNSISWTPLVELHPRNIPAKFHQDWPSGLGRKDV